MKILSTNRAAFCPWWANNILWCSTDWKEQ